MTTEELDQWFLCRLGVEAFEELYAMSTGVDDWTLYVDAEKTRREELDR